MVESARHRVHVESTVVIAGGVASPARSVSVAHEHVVRVLVQHPQGGPQASRPRVLGLGDGLG